MQSSRGTFLEAAGGWGLGVGGGGVCMGSTTIRFLVELRVWLGLS